MSRQESAQTLALQALVYLLSQDDTANAFVAQTGLAPGELAARASDPDLLAAVMDFVLSDDAFVLAVAGAAGVPPEELVAARAFLPGGDVPHWT